MKSNKKIIGTIIVVTMLSLLSSCVVVVHDHPHRHWHHERVIVR
jgi:hypothetical protein